jgi:hypothetical protein
VLVAVSFANLVILASCDDAATHSGLGNIWMQLIEMEGHSCDFMVQAALQWAHHT